MANHVDNHLTVTGNHAAIAEYQRIFAKLDEGIQSASFLPEWDDDDKPSYDWMYEHVGAKWAYVDDVEDNWFMIVSAWSSIFPFVQQLGYHLETLDPSVRIELTYIDECHNFAGAAVFTENGWDVKEEDHTFFENVFDQREGISLFVVKEDIIRDLINSWVEEMN